MFHVEQLAHESNSIDCAVRSRKEFQWSGARRSTWNKMALGK